MSTATFDTLRYFEQLRDIGVSEKAATKADLPGLESRLPSEMQNNELPLLGSLAPCWPLPLPL